MNLLVIHPVVQVIAIFLALYTAYLGLQRTRSLHFGKQARFRRDLHAGLGTVSLVTLLGGMAGGAIMASRFLEDHQPLESLHGKGGLILLPFLLIGLFTGFYLYIAPPKGKILSIIHGVNNLIILGMILFQVFTGIYFASHL